MANTSTTTTRFNPPPNWPPPPPGWTPPTGWRPDLSWGPPPPGWQLWVEVPVGHREAAQAARNGWVRRHKVLVAGGGALALVLGVGAVGAAVDGVARTVEAAPSSGSQPSSSASSTTVVGGGGSSRGSGPQETGAQSLPGSPSAAASSAAAADGGVSGGPTSGITASPSVSAAARPGTALAALATLAVKGRAPMTGYSRDRFGQAWADVDRNGCDTRNDVLRRDLVHVVLEAGTHGCVVLSGDLSPEPYSGQQQHFVRGAGTSTQVQIDHVVALGDAWQKGAQQWSAAERLAFANDPLELLAVNGRLNQQKGDGDTATWLPPDTSYRCAYVARQVSVKAKYGLWVTAAERDAMARILGTCPAQPLLTSSQPTVASIAGSGSAVPSAPRRATAAPTAPTAPLRTSAPTTSSAPAPTSASLDPRFATCKAAKAAGYGPYVQGEDPEYDWYRDGDGDGVDCE